MAVRIRLKKLGRRHRPFFRVCAMDSRAPRNGRVIEELGTYDPMIPETDARAVINGERIAYWMSVGAKPTPKVGVLIKKYGKDGSHLDQQQAALNRIAARRSDAITAATEGAKQAASAAAAQAEKDKAEAEAKAAAEAAEAEKAAAEAAEAAASEDDASQEDAAAEAPAEAETATENTDEDEAKSE